MNTDIEHYTDYLYQHHTKNYPCYNTLPICYQNPKITSPKNADNFRKQEICVAMEETGDRLEGLIVFINSIHLHYDNLTEYLTLGEFENRLSGFLGFVLGLY